MKTYRLHLIVLAGYGLLAMALTWPLAARLATSIPGTPVWAFDESTFVWNMWWFKFSLLGLGQSPLHSNYIFYPLGIDLVLYTFNFFNAMLGLPLTLLVPLPLASNLVILFAYVASGYGAYLLVCYILSARGGGEPETDIDPRLPAFVAGAAYAFAASRMVYAALGHYDMVTAQWFPFYALFLLKTLRQPGYRPAVLAGVCAGLALLAEMIFGVFLLFLTLILIAGELSDSRRRLGSILPRLGVVGLTAALVWSPVMIPVLRAFTQADYALAGWGEGLKLSADLAGWFTPTPLHPWLGVADWPAYLRAVIEGNAPFRDVNTVFLGFGILALALTGAVAGGRRARAWAWGAVAFAVFTLGPLLQINGRFLFSLDNLLAEQGIAQGVTFPLPFALLHYLPIIQANRAPNRFSVVLTLALAVLVGYGVVRISYCVVRSAYRLLRALSPTSHTSRSTQHAIRNTHYAIRTTQFVAGLSLVIVLFDQVSVPLPLSDARAPAPYAVIASQPGNFAILELPLGWRNSFGVQGAERTQLQYYQAFHGKYLLAGNISRAPAFKFDYFKRIPLFKAFIDAETYQQPDAETLQRARAQAADLMALYDVRYLVVHDPIPLRYPYVDTMPAARDLALALLPVNDQPVASRDGAVVYQVEQPPVPDPLRLDFGDWASAAYRGEGWGDDEQVFGASANWVVGTRARMFFPVRGPGERRLSMRVAPFAYPDAPAQAVTLSLNDRPLDVSLRLEGGWQIVSTRLPEGQLRQGLDVLTLEFDHAAAPSAVAGIPDDRQLSAAVDWVEIQ